MPTYITGKCETCGTESERLLPVLLKNKDNEFRFAFICPICCLWFEKKTEVPKHD